MRIALLWPDGKLTTGSTWDEVERAIRSAQPETYRSRREFRDEMRHRASTWSGVPVKATPLRLTARAFIHQLADHGLFMIDVEETENA